MRSTTLGRVVAVLVVLVCAPSATVKVMAQLGSTGAIQGTITDPGGSVVPGARVVATNVATNVETTRHFGDPAGTFHSDL
jgi:hypothetical protein